MRTLWSEPVEQQVYRSLLRSASFPGSIASLRNFLQGNSSYLGILAALCDHTTTLCDVSRFLSEEHWLWLEARPLEWERAGFILADARKAAPQPEDPCLGALTSPERGATIVLVVDQLGSGETALYLQGPGIAGERLLRVAGLHPDWMEKRARWVSNFPLGVDVLLADHDSVSCIPRTSIVHASAE